MEQPGPVDVFSDGLKVASIQEAIARRFFDTGFPCLSSSFNKVQKKLTSMKYLYGIDLTA